MSADPAAHDEAIPSPGPPEVSVVVATHDRPSRLSRLLEGLEAQTLESSHYEIIVVDDGSRPPTPELLARWAAGHPGRRVVRHDRACGPGAARNAGWRRARGALIAFIDDDCVPTPRWLEAALSVARGHRRGLWQGRTLPEPRDGDPEALYSRTLRIEHLGPAYETCNIFYPRAALQDLGGFDESFGLTPGGEDTDLAWRAIAAGHEPCFLADALVHHAVEDLGPIGKLRVAWRWTRSVRVYAEHPGTRAMLKAGLFWNLWHYLMVRSLIALVAPRWLRRMVLTWHLLELRGRARRAGAGTIAVPYLLAHDLVETAAVVRGAIRYRTWVL